MESSLPRKFIEAVAKRFAIAPAELAGRSRTKRVAYARAVVCYMLKLRGFSSTETGRAIGRDHSSVLWALKQVPRIFVEMGKELPKTNGEMDAFLREDDLLTYDIVELPSTQAIDVFNRRVEMLRARGQKVKSLPVTHEELALIARELGPNLYAKFLAMGGPIYVNGVQAVGPELKLNFT